MASPRDRDHPFYRPLWRRILIVAVAAGWTVFELVVGGNPMWLVIAIGILAYAVWSFLITYPGAEPPAS